MSYVATGTIQNGKVSADLTDFPVYIDLSDMPASFWSAVSDGGGDIRCYKSDGTTELAREVVSCATSTETGELHVKFSGTLSSSVDTEIQIHADGVSADYAVTATYGRNAVWSDYGLVFHGDDATDSTGNNTYTETGSPSYSAGKLGNALDAARSGEYLRSSSSPTGIPTGKPNFSTTQWIKYNTLYGYSIGLSWGIDATPYGRGYFPVIGDGTPSTWGTFWAGGSGYGNINSSSPASTTATWYHAVTTYDQTTHRMFIDSAARGTTTYTGSNIVNSYCNINKHPNVTSLGIDGQLDEVRIANFTYSSDWITTEYNNQSAPTTFYSVTAVGGGATGYANKVMGVASANIGKVMGVATANISKVMGV